MKYSLELYNSINSYAGYKAVNDACKIVHALGYKPIVLRGLKHSNNWIRYYYTLIHSFRLFLIIKQNDVCFLQWPLLTPSDKILYYVIKLRCKHLQILIHDLTSVRTNENTETEIKYLRLSELIVVHNTMMKDYLISLGINKTQMKTLDAFDYLIDVDLKPNRSYSKDVVFAGRLSKSLFLLKIMSGMINLPLICYGETNFKIKEPLLYRGIFNPNDVSIIQGSWGLVWDGDSIDGCNGMLGSYLRINSPHKLSLYIVARLPVIVWSESAISKYVLEKGIGICIVSLKDVLNEITKVSESKYGFFLSNIDKEREQLSSGIHLKNCLL